MKFEKIGFIGLGLIGGSIAKAIKVLYPGTDIIATSGHFETIADAAADSVISNQTLLPITAFADRDLIFLCCPVKKNIEYLEALKPVIAPHCIITDVGSVKGDIHKSVTLLNMEANFIGGHPMAGSEKTGYRASHAELLKNAYYILTPTAGTGSHDLEQLRDYVASFGAIPMILDPDSHDHATASISHLPHILAASLVNLVARTDDPEQTMKRIAAGGFRDITRIASSSPVMWQNICSANQQQILSLIRDFKGILTEMEQYIASEDTEAISQFFSDAKEYRDSIQNNEH
ncbi:MAG: prephenate dehydrogenase [Roseburia sp.]